MFYCACHQLLFAVTTPPKFFLDNTTTLVQKSATKLSWNIIYFCSFRFTNIASAVAVVCTESTIQSILSAPCADDWHPFNTLVYQTWQPYRLPSIWTWRSLPGGLAHYRGTGACEKNRRGDTKVANRKLNLAKWTHLRASIARESPKWYKICQVSVEGAYAENSLRGRADLFGHQCPHPRNLYLWRQNNAFYGILSAKFSFIPK